MNIHFFNLCYERKQEELKKSLIKKKARQLPPPDLYNAGANIPFQFQEEEKMPYQQQNYVYDNPVGFHQKKGQQFLYLSQTPTELMQIYPSNFKESSAKDQHIKGKTRWVKMTSEKITFRGWTTVSSMNC